ncbi:MAG: hypothetical protein QM791_15255 [Ferruginibacter sp.]
MKHAAVIILISLFACNAAPDPVSKDAPARRVAITTVNCDYQASKTSCKKIFAAYKQQPTAVSKERLIKFICDSLMPCWYGTPWDFNGTSTQPGTGSIACGYFVTTVLQDAGVTINRSKMAQCASSILVEKTCTAIERYSNKTIEHFVNGVKLKGKGLYITGLDAHTGFIYNDGREVYFIHSSIYPPRTVVKEKALESAALRYTKFRMIGMIRF